MAALEMHGSAPRLFRRAWTGPPEL